MEHQTLGDAALPGLVAASGEGGSSGSGSSLGTTCATAPRQRKPMRWRRIPRDKLTWPVPTSKSLIPPETLLLPGTAAPSFRSYLPPPPDPRGARKTREEPTFEFLVVQRGSKEAKDAEELGRQQCLEMAKEVEEKDESHCDTEEAKVAFRKLKAEFASWYRRLAATRPEDVVFISKPPSDTEDEHLTAEDMEMKAGLSGWPVCPQAKHFATLALDHYNSTKKHKFEMARVLLSKCFYEGDGTTFAHVNFTATAPQQSASQPAKRLFFAELMLNRNLQASGSTEPMRVIHLCTIDDSCFGGCHEMVRDIKGPVRKNMDYDRCHACSERIKHPEVLNLSLVTTVQGCRTLECFGSCISFFSLGLLVFWPVL